MVVGRGSRGEFCGFTDCTLVRQCLSPGGKSLRIRLTVGDLVLSFEVAISDGARRYEEKRDVSDV